MNGTLFASQRPSPGVVWRALLRVVDVQELLTAQAAIAERLAEAGGPTAEAQTLRKGFNLLAKVLFTQRATVRDLHDLAWLDHLVVAKGRGLAKAWRGERHQEATDALAESRGRLGQLVPRRGSAWTRVPLAGVAGLRDLKIECGVTGTIRAGAVPHDELLELISELGHAHAPHPEGRVFLEDVQRLAVAARKIGSESVALVFASSVFDSG